MKFIKVGKVPHHEIKVVNLPRKNFILKFRNTKKQKCSLFKNQE